MIGRRYERMEHQGDGKQKEMKKKEKEENVAGNKLNLFPECTMR